MVKYSTVLFDADGTLFDFTASERVALAGTLTSAGLQINDTIAQIYTDINYKLWAQLEFGTITKDKLRIERFTRLFDQLGHNVDASIYADEYVDRLAQGIDMIDGAVDIVETLFGKCDMHIATNGISSVQRSRLKLSNMRNYFKEIFISDEIGYPKPHKEYFDYIFETLGIKDKSQIIIIGDSLASDIQGGINSGIDTCWFNPLKYKNKSPHIPKYEVSKLSQIKDIVF